MNWKIKSFALLYFLVVACDFSKDSVPNLETETAINEPSNYYSTEHLVEVEALQGLLDQPSMKVVDFRKREAFKKGHIPGALPMWRTEVEDTSYAYGGMMASKKQMEALLSGLGIRNSDTILVYDDRGSCDAARLWWILANYDFNSVKIINGGLDAWKEIGGSISTAQSEITASDFKLPTQSSMKYTATTKEMLRRVFEKKGPVIIDTRTEDEFSGKRQKKGAQAGGRIPGSTLIDWADCMDINATKKFKSYEALVAIYKDLELNDKTGVITYCHSGVRSAHTTFVLTQLLGYKNVRNYDGSWTEWSTLAGFPIEKDSVTTILN